jgi:hypothetical protein
MMPHYIALHRTTYDADVCGVHYHVPADEVEECHVSKRRVVVATIIVVVIICGGGGG